MDRPTDEQIRKDNPHFGPMIRVVEPVLPYQGDHYSHHVIVGAHGSCFASDPEHVQDCEELGIAPEADIFDAWATYMYDPSTGQWVLGAN